ncbi:AbrB/MazE/SpoVT family DNA-binding domain-containing protein [Moraxella nasovis]|uniref:antitoxin n=1 Tax=Moraxella nasovis TaxID=2904121 RepID=UPI001F6038AF|nr:AbrB/MazE/SpoVT family DNA-binding domain-containing protein [Moraxella nasovis]UNU73358.1 AbrB/MazE/SpoVT family DNA-binding domain-containing protein [Moraxella nasovis]
MIVTIPFVSGNSQAVRLPKALAFGANTPVSLRKENGCVIIEPVKTLGEVPHLLRQIGADIERAELVENECQW